MTRMIAKKSDAGFYYVEVGRETHYRVSYRVWVNKRFVKEENGEFFVEFPVKDAIVIKTEKGNFVLRPEAGITTYDVYVKCGYRGDSNFEIIKGNVVIEVPYYWYMSERGNLGVSKGAIVSAKGPILVKWERTGRLYGAPSTGAYWLYPDGTTREEVLDEELKQELE